MKLFIKNMVCPRCIKVVSEELGKLDYTIKEIVLGEVEIAEEPKPDQVEQISEMLLENGFELLEDKAAKLVEKIKTIIISHVHHSEFSLKKKVSELLEEKVGKDYSYLSSLFSSTENVTIEHYFILQKIEKAKELLKYGDLTLSEIAHELGYASVNHLSNQFKKVTGMTASEFKKNTSLNRFSIDKIA